MLPVLLTSGALSDSVLFDTEGENLILHTKEKSFCKTSFHLGMGLKKGQKQGRDERMQKDYPTSAKKYTADIG